MRFLGNKEAIIQEISEFVFDNIKYSDTMIFFDAFCGTGSVCDFFKDKFDIVINDNLKWATTYTAGRLIADKCTFEELGFDPFDYLNSNDNFSKGYMYYNYAPTKSSRMYFTQENAGRIDYFRETIEIWAKQNKISKEEEIYLLSCLVESVSSVSNTAGVYGSFLKKWDSRALKPIKFIKPLSRNTQLKDIKIFNDKIENIIGSVNCDILYLDPPYTQNQYGTQYHLLETLILNDKPESISKVTGSRPVTPMSSDWSRDYKCHILLDKIISKTSARHIVMSYNNDGFMSKEYIEAVLKRYGKEETYKFRRIDYKKYQNWKSNKKRKHYEYLFYIEKKDNDQVVYESPLNYIGNKNKIIPNIKKEIPKEFDSFIDLFGGGFNVGINIDSSKIIYNEINCYVKELIESFKRYDTYTYIRFMKRTIEKFNLEKGSKEAYLEFRDYYNSLPINKRDPRLLLVLILYSYNQQIRFNNSHEFNNPAGIRWFNDKILEKLVSFSRKIKEKNVKLICSDYSDFLNNHEIDTESFIYVDPPYMLTNGSYNDGKRGFKGWTLELEEELFNYLDILTKDKIKFLLSYVYEHKGKINTNLAEWIDKNDYIVVELGDVIGISGSQRKEILIKNYE